MVYLPQQLVGNGLGLQLNPQQFESMIIIDLGNQTSVTRVTKIIVSPLDHKILAASRVRLQFRWTDNSIALYRAPLKGSGQVW